MLKVSLPLIRTQHITWHDQAIPQGEIWLKLGGDKGGGTFKMCFQILNVPNPNSPINTCVFSIFEGTLSFILTVADSPSVATLYLIFNVLHALHTNIKVFMDYYRTT